MKTPPAPSAPVTIPLVVLIVHRNGTITVTKDGTILTPPAHTTWRRSSLPEIIETASERRTVPVWVEVRETDGASFTDLFPAQPQPQHHEEPPAASKPRHAGPDRQLAEVRAEGFIPGEDIAIASVVGHIDAAKDGTARTLIDPAEHPGVSEVVLVGRVSGTLAVRRLP
jgi:ribosomal protein L39E